MLNYQCVCEIAIIYFIPRMKPLCLVQIADLQTDSLSFASNPDMCVTNVFFKYSVRGAIILKRCY